MTYFLPSKLFITARLLPSKIIFHFILLSIVPLVHLRGIKLYFICPPNRFASAWEETRESVIYLNMFISIYVLLTQVFFQLYTFIHSDFLLSSTSSTSSSCTPSFHFLERTSLTFMLLSLSSKEMTPMSMTIYRIKHKRTGPSLHWLVEEETQDNKNTTTQWWSEKKIIERRNRSIRIL